MKPRIPGGATDQRELKVAIRSRDGNRCTQCGMANEQHVKAFGKQLEVHRTIPGSTYSLEGCVTLCLPCHWQQPKSKPHQFKSGRNRVYTDLPRNAAIAFRWVQAIYGLSPRELFMRMLEDFHPGCLDKGTEFAAEQDAAEKARQQEPPD